MEDKYRHSFFVEIIENIEAHSQNPAPENQSSDVEENLREISEFILFGEKFKKPEYFETVKQSKLLDTMVEISRHGHLKMNE